jgi:hypothetical protein
MNRKEREARKRGECLAAFLDEVPVIGTGGQLEEYLFLRNVRRYRITVIPNAGAVRIELPPHKLNVLDDVAARRPAYTCWLVAELPWWTIGRKVKVLDGRPIH